MAAPKYSAIPVPTDNAVSLKNTVVALKENVEVLTSQRGDRLNAAVTWQDLLDLELVTPLQVPKTPRASG